FAIHVVAVLVRHHFQRQLVVVAQKERPLTVEWNLGRLLENLLNRSALLPADGHEEAGDARGMKTQPKRVPLAQVKPHVPWPPGLPRQAAPVRDTPSRWWRAIS